MLYFFPWKALNWPRKSDGKWRKSTQLCITVGGMPDIFSIHEDQMKHHRKCILILWDSLKSFFLFNIHSELYIWHSGMEKNKTVRSTVTMVYWYSNYFWVSVIIFRQLVWMEREKWLFLVFFFSFSAIGKDAHQMCIRIDIHCWCISSYSTKAHIFWI